MMDDNLTRTHPTMPRMRTAPTVPAITDNENVVPALPAPTISAASPDGTEAADIVKSVACARGATRPKNAATGAKYPSFIQKWRKEMRSVVQYTPNAQADTCYH